VIGIYLILGAWDLDITSVLPVGNQDKIAIPDTSFSNQSDFWPALDALKF